MAATTEEKIAWFVVGWASVFALKYVVFGLTNWNNMFHPGLVIAPNQYGFQEPFFGVFSGRFGARFPGKFTPIEGDYGRAVMGGRAGRR